MSEEAIKFKNSVFFVVSFTFLLWVVKALEWAVALDFGFLGILPRTLSGTMGIITAPLIHGDALHLISNTFPLLLLGISVFYFYDKIALEVFAWIYFLSGFWVWMAARDAYHIGASGLVYGLVAFLFFSGLFRRDTKSLAISLIVIFLYGGMLQGLFPTDGRISWESHLLGAMAGAFCAFFYRDVKLQSRSRSRQDPYELQASSLFPLKEGDQQDPESLARTYYDYQQAIDTYPLQERAGAQEAIPPSSCHASTTTNIPVIAGEITAIPAFNYYLAGPALKKVPNPEVKRYIISLRLQTPQWTNNTTQV